MTDDLKTPEQMAEEHANIRCPEQGPEFIVWCMCRDDFLAGYQAAKPEWISVKERLPETGKVVLAAMPKGTVTLGGIRKKTQAWDVFLDMAICTAEPTHWMPLPEAPKEEK